MLAAERSFLGRGVWCDLVPTPRELASDCGMALEFRLEDLGAAAAILRRAELMLRGAYARGAAGFVQLALPGAEAEEDR